MSTVTSTRKIAQAIAQDLDDEMYEGWGDVFLSELKGLKVEQRKSLNIKHGTRLYKKVTPESYLKMTRRQPLFRPVSILGKDDNRLLAVIANRIISSVYQYALQHRASGDHMDSIVVFIRAVGAKSAKEHRGAITEKMLPSRAVIQIVPVIKYGSALESMLLNNGSGGIMYQAAKDARRTYKDKVAIRYDYVSGARIGEGGGTFPRLTVAFYGNSYPSMKTPGRGKR